MTSKGIEEEKGGKRTTNEKETADRDKTYYMRKEKTISQPA